MPVIKGVPAPYGCEQVGCHRLANGEALAGPRLCQEHLNYLSIVAPEPPQALVPLPPPASLPDCEPCGNRRYTLTGAEEGTVQASRCEACDRPCPRCKGVGLVEVLRGGYTYQEPCPCGGDDLARRLRAVNGAHLPGVYAGLLYGRLPVVPPSESQRRAHELAFGFARTYQPRTTKRGLFFHGPPGTGKTLALCRALAVIARDLARTVRYVHLPSYLDTQKDSWDNPDVEVSCVTELVRADVLLVDEVVLRGKDGRPRDLSKWESKQLDRIAHERWNAAKPTLWATNCTPAQIEAQASESTWSRIRATSEFLEVVGPDLRQGTRRRP
jgi:DNA replication protein DnaC